MSDPTMPGAAGGQQQVSEEELREYLGQMRQAPAAQLIADVFSALANGAQVKLGRRDARLLIDLAARLADNAAAHLDDRVNDEMSKVITQLRMAQVDAEQQLAQARAAGEKVDEPNDLDTAPPPAASQAEQPPADRAEQATQQQPPPQGSKASRLWVPGRP